MVPLRTCVGCRKVAAAEELYRVVAGPSGDIQIGRNLPGRGAWICRGSKKCVDRALSKGGLARALRTKLDGGQMDRLRTDLLRYASDWS
ncbi:MAG: YlxR family protein [Acidimicrobiales bacterium]